MGVISIYLNSWFYKEFVLLSYFYFYEEIFFFCRYREKTQHGKWFFVLFVNAQSGLRAWCVFDYIAYLIKRHFLEPKKGKQFYREYITHDFHMHINFSRWKGLPCYQRIKDRVFCAQTLFNAAKENIWGNYIYSVLIIEL